MKKTPRPVVALDMDTAPVEQILPFLSYAVSTMGSKLIHSIVSGVGETSESHLKAYEELRVEIDSWAKAIDKALETVLPAELPIGVAMLAVLQVGTAAMTSYTRLFNQLNPGSDCNLHPMAQRDFEQWVSFEDAEPTAGLGTGKTGGYEH